jgi:hypothetical protein
MVLLDDIRPILYTPERMNAVLPWVATKGVLTADFLTPTARRWSGDKRHVQRKPI